MTAWVEPARREPGGGFETIDLPALKIDRPAVYYQSHVARTVNPQLQAAKRRDILEAALHLVSTRGYQSMAIQELLDNLGISKGALYHYFPSKSALLEALVDHLLVDAEHVLAPVADDRGLAAPEALSQFFVALARYKATQRPFIAAVLPIWYSDDNAILRDKVRVVSAGRLAPMLASIIRRGCEEGSFAVSSPEQTARVVLGLTQDLADALARLLLTGGSRSTTAAHMQQMIVATTESVERVVGAPAGAIWLVEPGGLDAWLQSAEEEAA
jgi:AcrR family transcriptional regulator